jgi:hypothetical protein
MVRSSLDVSIGMTMTRLLILAIGVLVFTPLLICGVNATPVYYSVTGHYYDAIAAPGITWTAAKSAAESQSYAGVNGHLVTITSQGENDFIVANLGGCPGYWLGGFQPSGSPEPDGGWQWVTGEPWSYTNWYGGGPNNHYGGDQGIHPYGWPEDVIQFPWWEGSGTWNDFPNDIPMNGYIVEYDTPSNIGYTATVTGGQNTVIQSTDGTFGTILRGTSKTLSPSVVLNNLGDTDARVDARFADSVGGSYGLVSGTNVLLADNFAMGPTGGSLATFMDDGSNVQVATATAGTTTSLDARLSVPAYQPPGSYTGNVILTFSNT